MNGYSEKALNRFLQIPKGTESFYLEEAFIHRKISETLSNLFYRWGYLPIETPMFDFYDIYRSMLDPSMEEKIYKLVDRDGDLLMLRSDITLFMAKQMGLALARGNLPVRVCYSDAILRYQDRESISHNEFFQVGAELIGRDGIKGDLEIIVMLINALSEIGADDTKFHIGSRALFDSLFAGIFDEHKTEILGLIIGREWDALCEKLSSLGFGDSFLKLILKLFGFIGDDDNLEVLIDEVSNGEMDSTVVDSMEYLRDIYKNLKELGYDDLVRIDLSEVGLQSYYTGISFSVYTVGIEAAVASGGRYNNLLKLFGFDTPAVGFSILLRKLEPKIGKLKQFLPSDDVVNLKESDFISSYKKAEELRKKGKIVTL